MKLTELQEKWLAELESGKHEQAAGVLYNGRGYCCLGIACRFVLEIEPKESDGKFFFNHLDDILSVLDYQKLNFYATNGEIHPSKREEFYRILVNEGFVGCSYPLQALAHYNDRGATFKQLAAAIRKLPEAVFNNPEANENP